jgi:endonuclease/exonuclease/phosphatase family metal-dependent hydrolase
MITVATFNAHHGRPPRGLASNRLLESAVAGLRADVVGMQEVERRVVRSCFRHQPAAIARAAGMNYVYAPARRFAVTGDDGIALLVRGEIVRCATAPLPQANRNERRTSIVARVRVAGQEMTVATTHLHNGAPLVAQRQLDAVVEMLDAEPGPHILIGDLNIDARRVAAHLSSGFVLAGGNPTFPANDPTQRIDHIAVRGLDIESVAVQRLAVSDHCALLARLGVVDSTSLTDIAQRC